jgi:hypothetical protein
MSVTLTPKQLTRFAAALAEQESGANHPQVCVIADSPNLTRCAEQVHGKLARPDLSAVLRLAKQYGTIYAADMIANPGLPNWVAQQWEKVGFSVNIGLAPDCDDRAVRQCVQALLVADVLICMSGDHAFVDIIRLAKSSRRQIKVVVIGVRECTAACLIEACDEFVDLPVATYTRAA